MTDLTEEFEVSARWAEKYCYSKAWPLPRFSAPFNGCGSVASEERYEVVVSGAGPAGMYDTIRFT